MTEFEWEGKRTEHFHTNSSIFCIFSTYRPVFNGKFCCYKNREINHHSSQSREKTSKSFNAFEIIKTPADSSGGEIKLSHLEIGSSVVGRKIRQHHEKDGSLSLLLLANISSFYEHEKATRMMFLGCSLIFWWWFNGNGFLLLMHHQTVIECEWWFVRLKHILQ